MSFPFLEWFDEPDTLSGQPINASAPVAVDLRILSAKPDKIPS